MTHEASLLRLLREILGKYEPALAMRVRIGKKLTFSKEERLRICDHLTDELCVSGLAPDYEPNAHGKQIECLIDMLNEDEFRQSCGNSHQTN